MSLSLFHNDYLQLKIVKVNILHHAIRQESGFRSFGFSTHAHILWRQGDNLAFLTKMKREESPPLSSDKDAFGGGTDESGTESETGRSLAIVETMNVRPEIGRASAEFLMLFQESRAPSFGAYTMNIKRTLPFIVWWHC